MYICGLCGGYVGELNRHYNRNMTTDIWQYFIHGYMLDYGMQEPLLKPFLPPPHFRQHVRGSGTVDGHLATGRIVRAHVD